MGVTTRPMAPPDREDVRRILAGSGAFSQQEIETALEMADAGLDGEYALLVAEAQGAVCAFACFGQAALTATTWYLYWICVDRGIEGTGVGRALQAGVEAAVSGAGGERLVVETSGREDYARTRRFYAEGGFSETGRIADFYKENDDCVIYCKRLR